MTTDTSKKDLETLLMRHLLFASVCGAALTLAGAALGRDPEGAVNLAGKAALPAGNGLAMEISKDGKYWGNSFGVPAAPIIPRGRWICVEFMLKHNTPGQPDGEQAFWINGALQGHWKGINWRKTALLKANALTLESYITDRWTTNQVNVAFFDNVVLARRYIGPVGRN
jgi:hypothetical protein